MSKFTVMYKSTNSMYLNVEADSLEEAAQEQLEMEGYEVYWINTCEAEICF